jgi:hypothetical protein
VFNQQFTKIQTLERANRKHRGQVMRFGMNQHEGTRPHASIKGEAVFKPIPVKVPDSFGLGAAVNRMFELFGWRRPGGKVKLES